MSEPAIERKGGAGTLVLLSFMMFLQFFVWGAWYVSMTGFINAQEMSDVTAAAYTVGPIAAILSPFFLGMIADRFFASQRVLGVLHLVGGLVMLAAPAAASPFEGSQLASFGHPFILVLLGFMLCYMPTLGLSSSVALHNMSDPKKHFPIVRVWGTIGWIVGNLVVQLFPEKDASAIQFYATGGAAIALGVFAFLLPHTPPPLAGSKPTLGEVIGLDSLRLFKKRSYAVFIVCSFLICIPLAGYYNQARNFVEATGAVVNGSATFSMSFGQMSEILFMLVMPLFFARLGVKWMLAIGMLAWVARYGLFAGGADEQVKWMVLGGIILHGICYDFFFVTGQIYVDNEAGAKIRSQAQGFYVLVTQGLGLGIGAQVFAWLVNRHTSPESGANWVMIWGIPAAFAFVILVVFVLLFRDRDGPEGVGVVAPESVPAAGLSAEAENSVTA